MLTVSIIIIVKGRARHLRNLLRGVQAMHIPKHIKLDVCVIHMNERIRAAHKGFSHHFHAHRLNSHYSLPLAQARNEGARKAKGNELIFLDVDCIPHKDFLKDYMNALNYYPDALLMGEVHYMHHTLPVQWDPSILETFSRKHAKREYPVNNAVLKEKNYHRFWSLNFALSRQTWERIGGFDTGFTGYGAEDTDFTIMAKHACVGLYWLRGAKAYHQYHGEYSPPLQHFDDIISNARTYHKKWGYWPMEHWLKAFKGKNYIRWNPKQGDIDVIARPTKEDVENAKLI